MDPREAVLRAEDLQDLLSHIAWTDTVKPALSKLQDDYQKLLTQATLGTKVFIMTNAGRQEVSPLHLAARIQGINFAIDTLEKILKRGDEAIKSLHSELSTE